MEEDVEALVRDALAEHSTVGDLADIIKDGIRLQPMEDGHLNHVFRAMSSSDQSKSCIVKVYRSYAKVYGKETPLEPERSQREAEAIAYIKSILPDSCATVLFHDEAKHIVCLEDLRDFTIGKDFLLTQCNLQAGAKLADALVTLHSSSHRLKIGDGEFDSLKQKLCSLPQQTNFLCDTHFTQPFSDKECQNNLDLDESVRQKLIEVKSDAAVIKAVTLAKEWMAVGAGDCFIHGDLHVNSLMFKDDQIKIIDLECARVGPPAFDIALLVCNYVLLYHYHQHKARVEGGDEEDGPNHSYCRRHLLDLICITLTRYMESMGRLLGESFDHHQVWKQVLLFLGVEIIAWISGPPSLPELKPFPKAQLDCINTALRILHKQSLSLETQDLSNLIHS